MRGPENDDEAFSFPECVDIARAVRYCSQSLIEGTWSEESTLRGRRPTFTPSNFESAKAFLRATVDKVHSRRSYRSLSETPLTSRHRSQTADMPTCHGCHGPIGQSQHMGSATGPQHCTLVHSLYCRGGVVEDTSWRACPPNYQFDPSIELANGPGFEESLNTFDFQPTNVQQSGPAYSTPVLDNHSGQQHHHLPQAREERNLGAVSRHQQVERFPGRVVLDSPPPDNNVDDPPPEVVGYLQDFVQEPLDHLGAAALQPVHQVPQQVSETVQREIDSHRASNQVENNSLHRPGDFNITDLRRDVDLRVNVDNFMENQIRQRIPSLSAAATATVSGADLPHGPGDGIRVTPSTGGGMRMSSVIVTTTHPITTQASNQGHYQQSAQPAHAGQHQHQTTYSQYVPPPHVSHSNQSHHSPRNTNYTPPYPRVPQPVPAVSASPQAGPEYCYEWVTDARGAKMLIRAPVTQPVPVQQTPTQLPLYQTPPQPPLYHNHTQPMAIPSSTRQTVYPQQPSSQPDAYQTEYRCSPATGKVWQVRVPVQASTPPVQVAPPASQFRYEWRIHPHTGVSYQVQVALHSPQPQQTTGSHSRQSAQFQYSGQAQQQSQVIQASRYAAAPRQATTQFVQPRQVQQPQVHHSSSSHGNLTLSGGRQAADTSVFQHTAHQEDNDSMSRQERVAGIVSLMEGGTTTRKHPKLIETVKKCPVRWSKQATMNNINLPLFAWGSVAELESSLSGRAEAMSEDMMLGKLRHLQNVLEVCCLSSAATDFTGYSWQLARDYAAKVENDIEQKLTSWPSMQAGVRTATLMAAQMENPRPSVLKDPKKSTFGERKEICTTYNKCKTEGKCDYEVGHPGKTCQRKHECSSCREKKNQSWRHQAWNCKARPADH